MFRKKQIAVILFCSLILCGLMSLGNQSISYAYDEDGDDYLYEECDHSEWERSRCIRIATPKSKGIAEYRCDDCGAKIQETYSWKKIKPGSESGQYLYDRYYRSYDIKSHTIVYRSSKSVTVKLRHALKGSVLKVKIGKKTYSKKISDKKTIKIPIKNQKAGNTVTFKVYYKGKVIGDYYEYYGEEDGYSYSPSSDQVYYAKNIKLGMTKNQVKNLYNWGPPSSSGSSSSGLSYWYYSDGSYIRFKNGKVSYWYDAEN